MPIYDYECDECGHRFELKQSFNAEPECVCPHCEGKARRKFHSVAVIYKGSGFYTTDYKKNGYSPAGEEKSTPSVKSDDRPANKEKASTTASKTED